MFKLDKDFCTESINYLRQNKQFQHSLLILQQKEFRFNEHEYEYFK